MKNRIKSFLHKINFIKRYKELKEENINLKKQLNILSNSDIVILKKKYTIDFVRSRRYIDKEYIDDINGIPTSYASDIIKLYKRDCEKEILENYIRPLMKYSHNDDAFCIYDDVIAIDMVCPVLIEKTK